MQQQDRRSMGGSTPPPPPIPAAAAAAAAAAAPPQPPIDGNSGYGVGGIDDDNGVAKEDGAAAFAAAAADGGTKTASKRRGGNIAALPAALAAATASSYKRMPQEEEEEEEEREKDSQKVDRMRSACQLQLVPLPKGPAFVVQKFLAGRSNQQHDGLREDIPYWRQWKGNDHFFCNGRVMLGCHTQKLVLTTFLITITWLLMFLFILPNYEHWALFGAAPVLAVASILALGNVALRDPGVLPRRPQSTAIEGLPLATKVALNYCSTCHILRPPRAKHCRRCNNCIMVHDHHCPWTGSCIGGRNYRPFLVFIVVIFLAAAFSLCLSAIYMAGVLFHAGPQAAANSKGLPGSKYVVPVVTLWTFLVSLCVGLLLLFHLYLQRIGKTTNEYIRREKSDDFQVVGMGECFKDLFCGRKPPRALPPSMRQRPTAQDVAEDQEYPTKLLLCFQRLMEDGEGGRGPPL
jgi:palmitoyltransferase ZDHHC9/14/18